MYIFFMLACNKKLSSMSYSCKAIKVSVPLASLLTLAVALSILASHTVFVASFPADIAPHSGNTAYVRTQGDFLHATGHPSADGGLRRVRGIGELESEGAAALVDPDDSLALVALFNSTGGPDWNSNAGWLAPDQPVSNWYGVTVQSNRVTSVSLASNNLSGTLPTELGDLTELDSLDLHSNQLAGSIPWQLGQLSGLFRLNLRSNQLSGAIPPELGDLPNIVWLNLRDNQLSGDIPAELGQLSTLRRLYLNANTLEGSIPTQFGELENLEELWLNDNQLIGSIPEELGALTNLQRLYLNENQLSGSIPAQFGELSSIVDLSLSRNQLTGPIPAELGSLAQLEDLYLYENQLSGPIPAELGALTNLVNLSLRSNQLTGEIPEELDGLTALEDLYLYENQLSGSIPAELGSLTELKILDLSTNDLVGELPSEFGDIEALKKLYVNANKLTGVLPLGLSQLDSLDTIHFLQSTGTDQALCASLDPSFQAWLQSLSDVQGPNCPPPTSVADVEGMPTEFLVHGNHPNPFSRTTRITLDLPQSASVTVKVFDLAGRKVLVSARMKVTAGRNRSIILDGSGLSPGFYVFRVQTHSEYRLNFGMGSFTIIR